MFGKITSQMKAVSVNTSYGGIDPSAVDIESMTQSVLSKEQAEAIDSVNAWYNRGSKDWMTCGGVAGCVLPDTKIKVRKKSNKDVHKIKVVKSNNC